MLFALIYRRRPSNDETEVRRLFQRFMAWEPPEGLDVKAHYAFVSGGGVAVVDAPDVGTLRQAIGPFAGMLDIQTEPALNIPEAIAISMATQEWVDTLP